MPELPEVQTIIDELIEQQVPGRKIQDIQIHYPRLIATHTIDEFLSRSVGYVINHLSRRGKFIIFELENGFSLLVHLRMSGKLLLVNSNYPGNKHDCLELIFAGGERIVYNDVRKFGRFYLTANPEQFLAHLGIEPLSGEFTVLWLKEVLRNSKKRIKPLLLDQRVIAGLGNIYVDEALWEARIHPERIAGELRTDEVKRLHGAIIKVLRNGLEHRGTSLGVTSLNYLSSKGKAGSHQQFLKVFRREGKDCYRCGGRIVKFRVAQRGTHICPGCQIL